MTHEMFRQIFKEKFTTVGKDFLRRVSGVQTSSLIIKETVNYDVKKCMSCRHCPTVQRAEKLAAKVPYSSLIKRGRGRITYIRSDKPLQDLTCKHCGIVCMQCGEFLGKKIPLRIQLRLRDTIVKRLLSKHCHNILQNGAYLPYFGIDPESVNDPQLKQYLIHTYNEPRQLTLDNIATYSQCYTDTARTIKFNEHNDYCAICPNSAASVTKNEITVNEARAYGIAKKDRTKRLSKIQIKLALYYHMMLEDESGFAIAIDLKQAAELLDCDVKSIKAANAALSNHNFIDITRVDSTTVNIYVPDRHKYGYTKEQGGTGYMTFSAEQIIKLIDMPNVVTLRTAIRQLIEDDNKNIHNAIQYKQELTEEREKQPRNQTNMHISEAKSYFPEYLSHTKAIKTYMEDTKSLFDVVADDTRVTFSLKPELDGRLARKKVLDPTVEYVTELVAEFNLHEFMHYDDIFSLANMCIQYGRNYLHHAFTNMRETFARGYAILQKNPTAIVTTPSTIKSYPRYVRMVIRGLRRDEITSVPSVA